MDSVMLCSRALLSAPFTSVRAIVPARSNEILRLPGSGTTLKVAADLLRQGVGLDLSFAYLSQLAKRRVGLRLPQRFEQQEFQVEPLPGLFDG